MTEEHVQWLDSGGSKRQVYSGDSLVIRHTCENWRQILNSRGSSTA